MIYCVHICLLDFFSIGYRVIILNMVIIDNLLEIDMECFFAFILSAGSAIIKSSSV
jgi:hypothetical protein